MVFEEVIVFTVADSQEVKQVPHIDIVSQRAEVADQFCVEVEHVLEVTALADGHGAAHAADLDIELLHLPGQDRDLALGPHHQAILPDPLILKQGNIV